MADVRFTTTILGIATNPNDNTLVVTLQDEAGGNGQITLKMNMPNLIVAWAVGQTVFMDLTAVSADQTAIASADPSLTPADTEN